MRAERHTLPLRLAGGPSGQMIPATAAVKGAQRAAGRTLDGGGRRHHRSSFHDRPRHCRSIWLSSPQPVIIALGPLDIGSLSETGAARRRARGLMREVYWGGNAELSLSLSGCVLPRRLLWSPALASWVETCDPSIADAGIRSGRNHRGSGAARLTALLRRSCARWEVPYRGIRSRDDPCHNVLAGRGGERS